MASKFVIIQPVGFYGRTAAIRGLSFETREAAEAHIAAKFNPKYAKRLRVEERAIRADDTSERMTCQCCDGKYLARMGTVTHHGYERPGGGYQTSSCIGAKFLPFEKDHARLDKLIEQLAEQAKNLRASAAATAANEAEVAWTMRDYTAEVRRFGQCPDVTVRFTKDTFAEVYAANEKNFSNSTRERGFEYFRDAQVARLLTRAKQTEEFKADREAFRKTWKHTHDYNKATKEWVAL